MDKPPQVVVLASRSFAALLTQLKQNGYVVRLNFLWLPNPQMAVDRVAARVQLGGHSVPIETVRRRYFAGLVNFFNLYQPLADDWFFFDNSVDVGARLIASGGPEGTTVVVDAERWAQVNQLRMT
jgi:predicted ABC-type ATPase